MTKSFEWVMKCISSCENQWQLQTCYKLIGLFEEQYGKLQASEILTEAIINKQSFINN